MVWQETFRLCSRDWRILFHCRITDWSVEFVTRPHSLIVLALLLILSLALVNLPESIGAFSRNWLAGLSGFVLWLIMFGSLRRKNK